MGSDGTTVRDIKRVVGRYEGLQEKVEQLTIDFKAKEKVVAKMKKLGKVALVGAAAGTVMVAGPSALVFAASGETAAAVATASAATAAAIAGKVIGSAARSPM